jgi:hypothetical protein
MIYYIGAAAVAALVTYILVEYRIKKPDEIALYEKGGEIRARKGRWYPRHFTLAVSGSAHPLSLEIEAEAKGKLPIRAEVALNMVASRNRLDELVKAGGWKPNAVAVAAKELTVVAQSLVGEYAEGKDVEELSVESLGAFLKERIAPAAATLGLEATAVVAQSVDPADEKIVEAMRKRESARIFEETELEDQKARVEAARAKNDADEKIAELEHRLALKRLDLRKVEEAKDAELAERRVVEEMKIKRERLAAEREELAAIAERPELLLLSPQMARLAESAQSLRNARTVVSLSPSDLSNGFEAIQAAREFFASWTKGAGDEQEKRG